MTIRTAWRSALMPNTGQRHAGQPRWMRWLGGALLILLGWQSARLLMILVTPAGPLGPPAPPQVGAVQERQLAARFDPFFRTSTEAASGVVTALPLKLFGTRIDFSTGRGAAIIATPDGVQSSYLVGETIMPGAKLASVAGDHVEIDRNGTRERLYLDQSEPAPSSPTASPSMPAPPPAPAVAPAPAPVQGSITPSPPPPPTSEAANATL